MHLLSNVIKGQIEKGILTGQKRNITKILQSPFYHFQLFFEFTRNDFLNQFERFLPIWKLEKEVEYFVLTLLCIVGGIGGRVIAMWGVESIVGGRKHCGGGHSYVGGRKHCGGHWRQGHSYVGGRKHCGGGVIAMWGVESIVY